MGSIFLRWIKYLEFDPSRRLFDFGHAGVEFFFVLSGFIILHIHWKDLGHPSRFSSFAGKRFLRIYPMYWLVLAAIIPVYFFSPVIRAFLTIAKFTPFFLPSY